MSAAISTAGLGKRYRSVWALRGCNLSIEPGSVVALVGPNGAGKTTLLSLIMGLIPPSEGKVTVDGGLDAGSPPALPKVAFLAQDHPLYRRFSVADLLHMGRALNPDWDDDWAKKRLGELDIPLGRPAGKLSGGQQAQVSLTLALAKRAPIVLLDEPVAELDPLARRQFMAFLMERVAGTETTVIMSSHVLSDLERVCDYLVLLSKSTVQVAGDIEDIMAAHRRLIGPPASKEPAGVEAVIAKVETATQTNLLARLSGPVPDPVWEARAVSLEDIVLAYLSAPDIVYRANSRLSQIDGGR